MLACLNVYQHRLTVCPAPALGSERSYAPLHPQPVARAMGSTTMRIVATLRLATTKMAAQRQLKWPVVAVREARVVMVLCHDEGHAVPHLERKAIPTASVAASKLVERTPPAQLHRGGTNLRDAHLDRHESGGKAGRTTSGRLRRTLAAS